MCNAPGSSRVGEEKKKMRGKKKSGGDREGTKLAEQKYVFFNLSLSTLKDTEHSTPQHPPRPKGSTALKKQF